MARVPVLVVLALVAASPGTMGGGSTSPGDNRGMCGILLFAMGAIHLVDWLREPGEALYKLIAGAGFVFLAPHAFLHPETSWRTLARPATVTGWLYLVGSVLLAAGFAVALWGRFA